MLVLAQWLSLQTAGFALTEEVVLLLQELLALRGGHPPAVGTCGPGFGKYITNNPQPINGFNIFLTITVEDLLPSSDNFGGSDGD